MPERVNPCLGLLAAESQPESSNDFNHLTAARPDRSNPVRFCGFIIMGVKIAGVSPPATL